MRLPLRHLNTVVVMEANLLPVLLTIGISIIYIYIYVLGWQPTYYLSTEIWL